MRISIFRVIAGCLLAWVVSPLLAQDYLDLMENETSNYDTQIEAGKTLRKFGTGTITLNRSYGNGQAVAGVQVCEGTLVLTGANAWHETNEGYFPGMTGTIEIQAGAELQTAVSNAPINRETPVWINGGTLSVYQDCFLNNIRLTGGVLRDNKDGNRGSQINRWRACNGVDITVDGGAQSLISADLCLVKWNDGDDTKVNVVVNPTGDASGIDLNFTGAIYDHQGNYGGNYFVKKGDGVMQLSFAENGWIGGAEIQAGTLQFTGANSLGTGTVTLNGGTLKSLASAGSTVRNAVTVAAAGGTISANDGAPATFASISGSGALRIVGSVGFNGAGGYAGTVTVGTSDTPSSPGTLALGDGAAGTISAVLNVGSALQLASPGTFHLSSLTGAGNVTTSANSGTATLYLGTGVADSAVSETYTGQFAQNIALVKEGAGTLVLQRQVNGANVGNGQRIASLTVNGGKLSLVGTGTNGGEYFSDQTPITVNAGGTLSIDSKYGAGYGTILVDGGTLHFGASDTFAKSLTLKNGARVTASNSSGNDLNSFRVGYAKTNTTLVVDGTSSSAITANITLVKDKNVTDTFYIDVRNTSANLVMSGAFRDYTNADFHNLDIEKKGAGRLVLNRANGNELTFGGTLRVTEGSVEFAAAGLGANGNGYFPNNPVIVSNGAKAYVTGYCNLNRTPVTIQGDNSLLRISNQNYANNVTLRDGGDMEDVSNRLCMGWFMDGKITVDGTVAAGETGSTISGGTFQLVKGGTYKAIFDVSRTGAACDLVLSSRLTDHGGLEGLPLLKTGEGSMKIVNNSANSNTFAGAIEVQAGTLIVDGGGNVLGNSITGQTKSLTVGAAGKLQITPTGLTFPGSYTLEGLQIVEIDASGETPRIGSITTSGNITFGENAAIALVSDDVLDWTYFAENPITLASSTGGTVTGWENLNFDTSGLTFDDPEVQLGLNLVQCAGGVVLQTEFTGAAVPEPGSIVLLLLGTFGLLTFYRKKKIN